MAIVRRCYQLKCVWSWSLEWVMVECKYTNVMPICHFLSDGNVPSYDCHITVSPFARLSCYGSNCPNVFHSTCVWPSISMPTSRGKSSPITPLDGNWFEQTFCEKNLWIYLNPFSSSLPTQHIHIHTHVTHTHVTHIDVHTWHTLTHTHTNTHTLTHTYAHTHTYTHIRMHTHVHTRTPTNTRTQTDTHICIYKHLPIHIHTQAHSACRNTTNTQTQQTHTQAVATDDEATHCIAPKMYPIIVFNL